MEKNDNILTELKELKSSLVTAENMNVYSVPAFYFENLAAIVLNRIKTSNLSAMDEIRIASSQIASISRQTPYTVPDGYFENLPAALLHKIHGKEQSADEELASLSPLLAGMKKAMPYEVPRGYFEQVTIPVSKKETNSAARVISFTKRPVFRYAAAAMVTGLIALSGILFFNKKSGSDKPIAQVVDMLKNIPELQQDTLIEKFIDPGLNQSTAATSHKGGKDEIKELLKGIPDDELKDFQQQTDDIQDIMMTN
jgi:hypothetical protein